MSSPAAVPQSISRAFPARPVRVLRVGSWRWTVVAMGVMAVGALYLVQDAFQNLAPSFHLAIHPVLVNVASAKGNYACCVRKDGKKYNINAGFQKEAQPRPLFVNDDLGLAVAVVAQDAFDLPVLLDAGVERLELSAEERKAFLQAVADFAASGGGV